MSYPPVKTQDRAYPEYADLDNGHTGILFPTSRGWRVTSQAIAAGRAVYVRGVVSRPMKIHSISFVVETAAGSNDACDVAILDANLNTLASAGSTAGKLNVLGKQDVALTSDIVLVPRTIYYACFSAATPFGSTAASLDCLGADAPRFIFIGGGSAAGFVDADFQNATFPITGQLAVHGGGAANPVLFLNEATS